jgi:hypothetical protein
MLQGMNKNDDEDATTNAWAHEPTYDINMEMYSSDEKKHVAARKRKRM